MTPARFGRYEVRRVLGRGGMGVVYEGQDPQIDRPVAIKTIALDALGDDEAAQFEARFRAEMRSTGRLLHQNIVALHDAGRDDGTAYIVMELVPGRDLKRRLAAGERFGTAQVLAIARQLLAALAYAHARDVVHRDVKPANVMLQDDGQVKLCDFGVARLTDGDATRTLGGVVGTLRYASPEQIAGGAVDARTDLYAAAALLRELFGGAPPAAVDTVLQRALDADPARRFDSAEAFAAALAAAANTTPPPQRSRRMLGAALLLPLVAAGAWVLWPRPVVAPAPAPALAPAPMPTAASAASAASAAVNAAAPASRPAAVVAKPVPLQLDGSWIGLYACSETVGPRSPGINSEAFSAKIALDIQGPRISWSRSGKNHGETVIGRIDGRGRFSAEGEGWEEMPGRKNAWRVQASGQYNTRVQPARLEGQVQLLRSKDGSVARNCTLSAVPR